MTVDGSTIISTIVAIYISSFYQRKDWNWCENREICVSLFLTAISITLGLRYKFIRCNTVLREHGNSTGNKYHLRLFVLEENFEWEDFSDFIFKCKWMTFSGIHTDWSDLHFSINRAIWRGEGLRNPLPSPPSIFMGPQMLLMVLQLLPKSVVLTIKKQN